MDIKWIIILVLVVLSYFQFVSPEKTNGYLEPIFGRVRDFISTKNPLNNTDTTPTCTDEISKVCGSNGITYDNACKAGLAGITEVTAGMCL